MMQKEPYAMNKHSKIRKLNIKQEDVVEKLKNKSRLISIKEGSAYSVSDGAGMRYITPYALSLGASNMHIGLLAALPTMLGNLSQLFTIKAMEKHSRKRISVICAVLQAFMWLAVMGVGALFFLFPGFAKAAPVSLIAVYSLLAVFGAIITPAWTSWMGQLVNKEHYGHYFGIRNRVVGFVAIIAMLIAGFILDYFKQTKVFIGFAIIFFIAFIARLVSARLLKKQHEPKLELHDGYYFSLWQFARKMMQNNFGIFVLFVSLLYLGTYVASPFFSVYMLKQLNFSYLFYTLVIMSAPVSVLVFIPAWGKFADIYGSLETMKLCGYLVFLVPLLWMGSALFIRLDSTVLLIYLLAIELFSGFIWAGFNIAVNDFIFEAVTPERIGICTAYFSIFTGIGLFLGASLGGFISSINFSVLGLTPLFMVFLFSAILRLVIPLLLIPKIHEVRDVKYFGIKEARKKIMHLTPAKLMRYLEFHYLRIRP